MLILALHVCVVSSPALANDTKNAAKQHFKSGVDLYNEDDFTGALAEFLKAYELEPHYAVLFNIANCQKNLEFYASALENFEKYLAGGGAEIAGERKSLVEDEIAELHGLLSEIKIGCNEDGVSILIDGKHIADTPHPSPIYVDAGEHVLRLEAEGFETYEKKLILSRGEKASYEIHLEEIESAPEPEPVIEAPDPDPVEPVEPVEGKKKLGPGAFYAVLGVTGAALVASAVTGGMVLKKEDEFYTMASNDPGLQDHKKSTRSLALATDVLWGVAGAGVLTMIIVGIKTDFKAGNEKSEQSWMLTPVVSAENVGILLDVRM